MNDITSSLLFTKVFKLIPVEENFQNHQVNFFPNPANDFLIVDFPPEYQNISFDIYTISGQLVRTSQNNQSGEKININTFPNGMYFIFDQFKNWQVRFLKQ